MLTGIRLNRFTTLVVVVCLLVADYIGAYDTTITYIGGDQTGTFKLNGSWNPNTIRENVPERAIFDIGVTVSRLGMPSCLTIVPNTHEMGILVSHDNDVSGFQNELDTTWSAATQFPSTLNPLDSVVPICEEYQGNGMVISSHTEPDEDSPCWSTNAHPWHQRILYYRNDSVYLKMQVVEFEMDTSRCRSPTLMYSKTIHNVIFRYQITDDSSGYFEDRISIQSHFKKRRSEMGWSVPFREWFNFLRGRKSSRIQKNED